MKATHPISLLKAMIVLGILLSHISSVTAGEGVPALPGEPCRTEPRPGWSEPEKWVWQKVCEGKIADFNERYNKEPALDPGTPEGWSENREISPSFLETILLHEPYRSALPHQGVRVRGAWVQHRVELENATLDHVWKLEQSRIVADVSLKLLKSSHLVSFWNSVFTGTVDLSQSKVGPLTMSGARCTGKLDLGQIEVGGELDADVAEFSEIDLRSAKIEGLLYMAKISCTGNLNMRGIEVNGDLYVSEGAKTSNIDLRYAKVGGGLYIYGGAFAVLDLTGSGISTVLEMGDDEYTKPVWRPSGGPARLVLRDADVDAVQVPYSLDAFPDNLDMNGFRYTHLGERRGVDEKSDMALRDSKWFTNWLGKDGIYSPQPYRQLAEVLNTMGHPAKADDVLYVGKERERSESKKHGAVLKWVGLSLINYTIGYGYRYYYVIPWVIGLILLGAWVYKTTGPETTARGKISRLFEILAFSFDMLLPFIRLDERHYSIRLSGWQHYYFYAHRLVGYVLGLFIVAGLSGITKLM